jgi:hypothetical protein
VLSEQGTGMMGPHDLAVCLQFLKSATLVKQMYHTVVVASPPMTLSAGFKFHFKEK